MPSRSRWMILALALAGLGLATASSWVHYRVLTDPTYVSPCDINAAFNCTQVYLSRYGSLYGVPVALGGVIWFALVALLAGFSRPDDNKSSVPSYLFVMACIGLSVILYLAYASFFVLKTGCVLCMGTYVSVLGIFFLVSSLSSDSMMSLPVRLAGDLRRLASRPVALLTAVLYLVGAASLVAFFPKEGSQGAQAAARSTAPTSKAASDFEAAWNQQPRVNLGIPADGASVIVVKFNDYECPSCRQAEEFYKPVLERFAKARPGAVKYVLKDWPWNSKCNFNVSTTIPGHEAACDAAAAARMARDRGKYDAMAAWLYGNQATTPEKVRAAAQSILGVTDFDKEYALKLPDIKRDIADGGVLRIDGTPTFFINGIKAPMLPVEYFELAINLELKKAGQ